MVEEGEVRRTSLMRSWVLEGAVGLIEDRNKRGKGVVQKDNQFLREFGDLIKGEGLTVEGF